MIHSKSDGVILLKEGATLSPLVDPGHPLYDREEFVQERQKIVGASVVSIRALL